MTASRRSLLKTAAALPLLAACPVACTSIAPGPAYHTPAGIPLRRVRVSEDRVIRRIAGLRPFRPGGFVVRAERFDDKLVVHNYGHGGGGITLAPGTSWLACREALQSPSALDADRRRCAVIGAGVMGLTTARMMQDRGWQVTIHTRDLPPDTTSNVAGGQWSPTSVYDRDHPLPPGFMDQFRSAARFASRHYQNLVGPRYGVSWFSNYQVYTGQAGGDEDDDGASSGSDINPDLYPQTRLLGPGEHPFRPPNMLHFYTLFIDPGVYLRQMLDDFHQAGGQVRITDFTDRGHVLSLAEPVIFNCSGLGSRTLFQDTELIPAKGQLVVLLPQAEVGYLLINGGLYMFPRRDGILLGGTFERDEWSLEPDPEAGRRIISRHQGFFEAMDDPWA